MLSHACAFSPMHLLSHVWIDSLTYAFSRMRLFTYESTFSHMDRLSHVCFRTHAPFHLCIYFLTYGLSLSTYAFSRMRLFTYASTFSRMDWLSHLCFRTHAPFHLCIYFLTYGLSLSTYAFSRMRPFTYASTFSHMDWLSHLCFLTHKPLILQIYFLTYGLTLSPILSHACAFLPMHLLFHSWIDSLTYVFLRMRLFTYKSNFSRMDRLSHLSFLTHAPFYLWIYFLT